MPGRQDLTQCLAGDTEAGLRHCLPTAGTPCKMCSHPISRASRISSLILLVQELHYPALRQPLAWGSGHGRTGDISKQYFQAGIPLASILLQACSKMCMQQCELMPRTTTPLCEDSHCYSPCCSLCPAARHSKTLGQMGRLKIQQSMVELWFCLCPAGDLEEDLALRE